MNILIAAATKEEVKPLLDSLLFVQNKEKDIYSLFSDKKIDVLISGIGMTAMAFAMGKQLHKKYDLTINAGIAGSFNRNIEIGSVVNVTEDIISELGAEDDEKFLILNEMGLGVQSFGFKVSGSKFKNTVLNTLPRVKGITVNTVHGNEVSIKKIIDRLNPDVETMEGAAFIYACEKTNTPYVQIKAISNYVEKRDKSKWNIPLAITNLNNTLLQIIESI